MLPGTAINFLLALRMRAFGWNHWRRLVQFAASPLLTQDRLLRRILRDNRHTQFGQQHGFEAVKDYAGFVESVPVQTYESLRPFVEAQSRTGDPALTASAPVMYAQTSGTTGQPKLVPIVGETLRMHKWNQAVHAYVQYKADPAAYQGHLLGIVSPAVEGTLPSGIPYGSASGHIYSNMPASARAKYVLPSEVFGISDYELKYLLILRLALPCKDVSYIGVANPSTLLKLLSVLRARRQELLDDIGNRTFSRIEALAPNVRQAIRSRLTCDSSRVRELEHILSLSEPHYSDFWPDLRLLVTWTGGSCRIALEALKPTLGPHTRISELGYLSSEFRGTITVDGNLDLGFPTIHENFFEFVERDAWDRDQSDFLRIDQLEMGKEYQVIVTTPAGLYRYFMNDIVKVTGIFHRTPTLQFVQKGAGVTNITGEKLYENHVIQAVRSVEDEFGFTSEFFLVLADPTLAHYRLIVELGPMLKATREDFAERIDRRLGELNLEYASKRTSGRLGHLKVLAVRRGTGDAYKQSCISEGQREAQFKVVALQYVDDCSFPFDTFEEPETLPLEDS